MSKRDRSGVGPTGIPGMDALSEARRDSRFKLYFGVKIHSPSTGSVSGRTLDISDHGLSAMLSVELPIGEVVELDLTLRIGRVNVRATVRDRKTFRHGFQFVEPNPAQKTFRHGFQFVEPNPAQHLIRENCCLLERIDSVKWHPRETQAFTATKADIQGKNVWDDKLDALSAELQAIEIWDQAGEKTDHEDELDRVGFKARRLRRVEIICKIDALLNKK
jgi:hypothetical protein